ncbi:putative Phospholipase D1 [Hypsibius exemplaris]|uniref:phospholipase D n=1 Tax=Hypsibius exemplaris TaxID=2072580 RepID=A0A1W0X0V4_HYPEX|nr:putative Phospholipase D1 [Hypsibius exemplaris]
MMLVDDRHALIGSANITDRSLIGNRDSEIACLISDESFVDSIMDENPCSAGNFTGSLRLRLMMEHLGYMDSPSKKDRELFRDPISPLFWKELWLPVARKNASIFEQVFNCTPSDEVRDFAELAHWEQQPKMAEVDPETARRALQDLQGHLVIFPMGFLRNERLRPAIISQEGLMPATLWT